MSLFDLATQRRQYETAGFRLADLADDPVEQFATWFAAQRAAHPDEPNAMAVATASPDGRPAVRTVLLKEVDADGALVFFTNYESAKGRDLAANPRAEALFAWVDLARQVRVHGAVERLDPAASDEYFATRPLGSQLGAIASPQSEVLVDRADLGARLAAAEDTYGDGPVPRPEHWGGYRLVPETWEFWQGRLNRLHDRARYRRAGDAWTRERLAP